MDDGVAGYEAVTLRCRMLAVPTKLLADLGVVQWVNEQDASPAIGRGSARRLGIAAICLAGWLAGLPFLPTTRVRRNYWANRASRTLRESNMKHQSCPLNLRQLSIVDLVFRDSRRTQLDQSTWLAIYDFLRRIANKRNPYAARLFRSDPGDAAATRWLSAIQGARRSGSYPISLAIFAANPKFRSA